VKTALIGGANVDILGRSIRALRREDSNPARLSLNCGGVARNIAENLKRLGAEVGFAGAVGDDGFGDFLAERLAETGIRSRLIRRPGVGTGLYLALFEPSGKLFVAVNDMEAVESIGPADVEGLGDFFSAADLVIADANLRPDTLKALADAAGGKPLMADAVSAAKAGRLREILPRLSVLKANRAEAEVLAGRKAGAGTAAGEGLEGLCAALLETGLGELYITLGGEGCCCAGGGGYRIFPALPAATVNVNGAGDAFAAGVAYSYCLGAAGAPEHAGMAEHAAFGLACAAITMESDGAVSGSLTREGAEARGKSRNWQDGRPDRSGFHRS
jgi:pseudouridine kinase